MWGQKGASKRITHFDANGSKLEQKLLRPGQRRLGRRPFLGLEREKGLSDAGAFELNEPFAGPRHLSASSEPQPTDGAFLCSPFSGFAHDFGPPLLPMRFPIRIAGSGAPSDASLVSLLYQRAFVLTHVGEPEPLHDPQAAGCVSPKARRYYYLLSKRPYRSQVFSVWDQPGGFPLGPEDGISAGVSV